MFSILLLTTFIIGSIHTQNCPDSPVLLEYDATRYLGLWYEIQKFPDPNQQNIICVTAQYSIRTPGGNITVLNTGFNTYF